MSRSGNHLLDDWVIQRTARPPTAPEDRLLTLKQ